MCPIHVGRGRTHAPLARLHTGACMLLHPTGPCLHPSLGTCAPPALPTGPAGNQRGRKAKEAGLQEKGWWRPGPVSPDLSNGR